MVKADNGSKTYQFKGRINNIVKYADQDNSIVTGIKLNKQSYYECSNRYAGSNGTYLEFGEYHGMKLDIHFSLYDTERQTISLDGEQYRIQRRIKFDVYNQCKQVLEFQRMSPQLYSSIQGHIGRKGVVALAIAEYEKQDDYAFAKIVVTCPFSVNNEVIAGICNVTLQKIVE